MVTTFSDTLVMSEATAPTTLQVTLPDALGTGRVPHALHPFSTGERYQLITQTCSGRMSQTTRLVNYGTLSSDVAKTQFV